VKYRNLHAALPAVLRHSFHISPVLLLPHRVPPIQIPIQQELDRTLEDDSAILFPLQRLTFDELKIVAVMGDPEAARFANQVKDCLKQHGYDIQSIVYTSRPARGQYIELENDVVRLVVGRCGTT